MRGVVHVERPVDDLDREFRAFGPLARWLSMAFDAAPLGGHRFAIRNNQMPTRLSIVGHTLAFATDGDAVTAAVVHIAPGFTRVFQRLKG